jgi:type II secretory pathway component GspD/PulD (secretin)
MPFRFLHRFKKEITPKMLGILLSLGVMGQGTLICPHAFGYVSIQTMGGGFLSIEADAEPLTTLIPRIAKMSHLNVMIDESVTGNASVKLERIAGLEALKLLARMHGLSLQKYNEHIWMLSSQARGQELGLFRYNTQMIPLNHASSAWLASFLNTALFGSSGRIVVKANERNNSLVISGTEDEVALALKTIPELDVPRIRRVYQLSYGNAVDVARQLEASIFGYRGNVPMQGVNTQNSVPSYETVITEGSGVNEIKSGTSTENNDSGGEEGENSSSASSEADNPFGDLKIEVRSIGIGQGSYNVNSLGAIVLPNSKMNTVTIIGTLSQLEQAEALIPTLDAKPPQVSIQADLVEVSETALKELGMSFQFSESGSPWSFNLGALTLGTTNSIGFLPNTTFPDNLNIQIQALLQSGKAKSIASPHIIATHETETAIMIVDQVLQGQRFTISGNNASFGQTVPIIGNAGIVLDIIPKIGANGVITLRVRPVVSSVYATIGTGNNTIGLIRKRDLVAQAVSLKNGESMVVGGLIDSRETTAEQKIPGLSELPIVGAMFRSSRTTKNRSELLVLITPHIINQLEPTPIHRIDTEALEMKAPQHLTPHLSNGRLPK